jgi:hypothetical protein
VMRNLVISTVHLPDILVVKNVHNLHMHNKRCMHACLISACLQARINFDNLRDLDMEVDEGVSSSVLTDTPSSVSVSLHPLVVMNISDHFTRIRVQEGSTGTPPKGQLLNKAHVSMLNFIFHACSVWSTAWSAGRA